MNFSDHLRQLEKLRDSTRPSHSSTHSRQRYAKGGTVKEKMKKLAAEGRGGDTKLARIGPRTARMLDNVIHQGRVKRNPRTGLREYMMPAGGPPAPAPLVPGQDRPFTWDEMAQNLHLDTPRARLDLAFHPSAQKKHLNILDQPLLPEGDPGKANENQNLMRQTVQQMLARGIDAHTVFSGSPEDLEEGLAKKLWDPEHQQDLNPNAGHTRVVLGPGVKALTSQKPTGKRKSIRIYEDPDAILASGKNNQQTKVARRTPVYESGVPRINKNDQATQVLHAGDAGRLKLRGKYNPQSQQIKSYGSQDEASDSGEEEKEG